MLNVLVWAPRMGVKSGGRALALTVVAELLRGKQRMSTLYWELEKSEAGKREGASRE